MDPLYWRWLADYLQRSNVVVFEQDWLGTLARTERTITDPHTFLGNMAEHLGTRSIGLQYSMALPGHILGSTRYANVTTVRLSQDRFCRDRWDEFLYGSKPASAVGLWPWADVTMSSEPANLLLAALSGGPVGVGDRLGEVAMENLLQVARPDGVIVKPDAPLVPVDETYLNDARSLEAPMVASTFTDFGDLRTVYLFAYARGEERAVRLRPATFGFHSRVCVYSYVERRGILLDAEDAFEDVIRGEFAYYVIVPAGPSGIAVLGDLGQMVPLGKQRIAELRDDGILTVKVLFASGESNRVVEGFAPAPIVPEVVAGRVEALEYDRTKQWFRVRLRAGEEATAVLRVRLESAESQ